MSVRIAYLSMAGWVLLGGFVSMLTTGAVLAVWTGSRPIRRRESVILDERLARSEISLDEHHARVRALGVSRRPAAIAAATGLIVAGIMGTSVVAAVGPGGGFMRSMMSGMGSMMDQGSPGRSGAPPAVSAPTTTITAREFSFSPKTIALAVGRAVNIVFKNDGHMFHTATIGGLGLDLRANGGDQVAGSLTPARPGIYTFICSVAGHADQGMRGKIFVTRD